MAQSKEKRFQALKGKSNHTLSHYEVSEKRRKESEPVRNFSFCENSSLGLTVGFLFVLETLFFKAVKVASRKIAVQS